MKRNCRSEVILDVDDIWILSLLKRNKLSLEQIKEKIKISSRGLITHLNRLKKKKLINVLRLKFPDYKRKFVSITNDGRKILFILKKENPQ